MKNILKGPEPESLITHRCSRNADYNNLPKETKEELRRRLLIEQGYLCCYCMSRISEPRSRIEHWHSQKNYSTEQLNYKNLLIACYGNEGNTKQQHCDVQKGERDILFNPADSTHDVESKIKYLADGTIQSTNADFDVQLNEILNLNFIRLKDYRKAVVQGVYTAMEKRKGEATERQLQRDIERWQEIDEKGQLKQYCQVAVYLITKRISRAIR